MRVHYDPHDNAAWIVFGDASLRPVKTVAVPDIEPWTVNLDFDAAGRLLGIEVLDAREVLPTDFLARYADPA